MKRTHAVIGLIAIIALSPLSAFAKYLYPEYRVCMQEAVNLREIELLDSQRIYNDEFEAALEERRARYYDSWNQEDDREQRDLQRQADRDYKDRLSDARTAQKRRDRDIRDAFNDREDVCDDLRRSYDQAIRRRPQFADCRGEGPIICFR